MNQGHYKNVLFWTPEQYPLLQLVENFCPIYKHVLFNSSFSTGKTEVVRGMIQKLVDSGQPCHLIICSSGSNEPKKTILQLKLELEFQEKIKISLLFQRLVHSNKERFNNLAHLVHNNKWHHTFVDEFLLDDFKETWDESELTQVKRVVQSLWIIVGGVVMAKETDLNPENFKKAFGSDFFTPVMKYPLR